jgi:phosphoenolpyruvate carboxykinase (ATP)
MLSPTRVPEEARIDLSAHGLTNTGVIHAGLTSAALVELALRRGEGVLAANGAFVACTGSHTGRSPKDRFIVAQPSSRNSLWWGPVNRPLEGDVFGRLHHRVLAYLQSRDLFVYDGHACAEPTYRLGVRVIADLAWHALFARCLFRANVDNEEPDAGMQPPLTILCASGMNAEPAIDGTRTGTFVVLDLERRLVLIGGTGYAGEIKKSVFSVLNYLLPQHGVFPMHCSANVGPDGHTALFFGLSGTG